MSMISKQVEELRKYADGRKGEISQICRDAADTIEDLSAKVRANNLHGGWIPVSERLPEVNEYVGSVCRHYLIQDEFGDMHVAHLCDRGWVPTCVLLELDCDVVAWMPLPEPYEGGGKSE